MFARLSLSLLVSAVPLLAQDPLTKQAVRRLEEVEKAEPGLTPGDVKNANALLAMLDQAARRLNAVNDKTEATWKQASQRFTDLKAKIDAKAKAAPPAPGTAKVDAEKLAQLDKEIATCIVTFKLLSTKHLADPYRRQSTQKEIDGLTTRLAAFPAADEAVKPVATRLAEFQRLFADATAQLDKDVGAGAAVTTRLAELDAKYDSKNIPAPIEPPFTESQVAAWVTEVRRWRDTEIATDRQFLDEAAKNAAVDQQHVSRLRGWLDEGFGKRLAEMETQLQARLDADVTAGQQLAEFVLATDPNDKDQVTNRILGKGRFDENMARLVAAQQAIHVAHVFRNGTMQPGKETKPDYAGAILVQKAIDHLQKLAVACLDAVRMPAAASTDAELLRIATETLKQPSYSVPTAERIVINAAKTHHERRDGYISVEAGATKAKVTVYTYSWDQFQVTTAEKQGDEVWLFANTLKHYESGDPTTPVGRWILAERFQITRILPENVAK